MPAMPAVAAVAVTLDALADVSNHLVGEHHQVEVVPGDPRAAQRPPDTRRVGRARVDRHDPHRVPEVVALHGNLVRVGNESGPHDPRAAAFGAGEVEAAGRSAHA